jgi:hypothetical protein
MNISDGRTIHIFNARGAGDIERLASAIAEKLALQLFDLGGRLYWLSEIGQLTPVSHRLLQNLVARHFVSVRLANSADGLHFPEFIQLDVDNQSLSDLMENLVRRVAKGPSQPKKLSDQQRGEIRDRLKMGEPREAVAEAYGVDLATVKAMMAAAAA